MPTHNEALIEACSACPPSARVFHTLEIWQSSFDEPARIVANVGDDMFFGIEPGAPHDGGVLVKFTREGARHYGQCAARHHAEGRCGSLLCSNGWPFFLRGRCWTICSRATRPSSPPAIRRSGLRPISPRASSPSSSASA